MILRGLRQALFASLISLLAGCQASRPFLQSESQRADVLASILAGQERTFERVAFFKPAEQAGVGLEFTLAPLILPEVVTNHASSPSGGHCRLVAEGASPVVRWSVDALQVNGGTLARFTYTWQQRADSGETRSQGIRLTLNSAGQPVIWEILQDPSALNLVFIAKSLEAAAARQYGSALPNRRFAVERATADTPRTIVARLLDDGPVPMGPTIYVKTGTCSVATVICRCMPAQAREICATETYELLPDQAPLAWPDPLLRLPTNL